MTEADEQELFARVERLERAGRRWKALTTVLGVVLLLLLSLGTVAAVAIDRQLARALEDERRVRILQEDPVLRQRLGDIQTRAVEAEARKRAAQGAEEAGPRRPAGDKPAGP